MYEHSRKMPYGNIAILVLIIICVTMTYESKIEQYDEWHKELMQQYLVLQKKLKIEQSKTYQTAIELSKYDLVMKILFRSLI